MAEGNPEMLQIRLWKPGKTTNVANGYESSLNPSLQTPTGCSDFELSQVAKQWKESKLHLKALFSLQTVLP